MQVKFWVSLSVLLVACSNNSEPIQPVRSLAAIQALRNRRVTRPILRSQESVTGNASLLIRNALAEADFGTTPSQAALQRAVSCARDGQPCIDTDELLDPAAGDALSDLTVAWRSGNVSARAQALVDRNRGAATELRRASRARWTWGMPDPEQASVESIRQFQYLNALAKVAIVAADSESPGECLRAATDMLRVGQDMIIGHMLADAMLGSGVVLLATHSIARCSSTAMAAERAQAVADIELLAELPIGPTFEAEAAFSLIVQDDQRCDHVTLFTLFQCRQSDKDLDRSRVALLDELITARNLRTTKPELYVHDVGAHFAMLEQRSQMNDNRGRSLLSYVRSVTTAFAYQQATVLGLCEVHQACGTSSRRPNPLDRHAFTFDREVPTELRISIGSNESLVFPLVREDSEEPAVGRTL